MARTRRKNNVKSKFRKSKDWKGFRERMAQAFGNRDYVTGRILTKGFNLHHLNTNLTEESYCDISDESGFIPLNSYTHKFLHYLFPTYKKDPKVIERFVELLDKMVELEGAKPRFRCSETTQRT